MNFAQLVLVWLFWVPRGKLHCSNIHSSGCSLVLDQVIGVGGCLAHYYYYVNVFLNTLHSVISLMTVIFY